MAFLGRAAPAEASRRVFLWFADGGVAPRSVNEICPFGRPNPFRCTLGPSVDDCRQAIYALLDRWYAAADVVFTFVEPTDGGAFDTVALTSDGAWCDSDARTVSRSPLPLCTAVPRGSIAIFRCGDDAKACATLVAKEQAHLLGLQHSGSVTDVMNELGGTLHDGFEDRDNPPTSARCGRLQNSFQLLIERAGRWPGGAKPDPGTPAPPAVPVTDAGVDSGVDAAVPDAAPADDAGTDVADPGAVPGAGGGAGADAITTPGTGGAAVTPAGGRSSGGCDLSGARVRGLPSALIAVAIWLSLNRRQRSRKRSRGVPAHPE